ncbi:MAG: rhomboid family intramembrane serine protease [Chloroflexi bacterium]|nr:rhomboid family intramembrane serine protease [Chloroflexota bacterium]
MSDQNPSLSPDGTAPEPENKPLFVGLMLAEPRLTFVLLGVNVLIFMYFFSLSADHQLQFFMDWAKINELIKEGEYYRLFTSMFLHLNLPHLLMNAYSLYILGRDVESLFGIERFAVIYLLGGLSGSLASFIFTPNPSIGASGAIFALIGAATMYFYQHRRLHGAGGRRYLNQLVMLLVLNLSLGLLPARSGFRLDQAAHIGGLVGGLILAALIGPAYQVEPDPTAEGGMHVVDHNPMPQWVLRGVAYAAGLAVLIVYAASA